METLLQPQTIATLRNFFTYWNNNPLSQNNSIVITNNQVTITNETEIVLSLQFPEPEPESQDVLITDETLLEIDNLIYSAREPDISPIIETETSIQNEVIRRLKEDLTKEPEDALTRLNPLTANTFEEKLAEIICRLNRKKNRK